MRHDRAARPVREALLARRRDPPPARGHRPARAAPRRAHPLGRRGGLRRPGAPASRRSSRRSRCRLRAPARQLRARARRWRALGAARRALRRAAPTTSWSTRRACSKSALVARAAHGAALRLRPRERARAHRRALLRPGASRWRASSTRSSATASWWREVFGYARRRAARDYGIAAPALAAGVGAAERYYVALHAASRADKRWAEARWIELARRLARRRAASRCIPAAPTQERNAAARSPRSRPAASLRPPMTLVEAAALLARRDGVVGVDTGLTHLAVALGVPDRSASTARRDPALTGPARRRHGGEPRRPRAARRRWTRWWPRSGYAEPAA